MPSPRLIPLDAVPPTPWRNGGGVTRELLAGPAAEPWAWRISVAEVAADGPFSAFPGVERWFAVLAGAGVELDIDGQAHRVLPGDRAIRFDGAAATRCRLLAGPTLDLNLMLRGARGRLQPVQDGQTWPADGSSGGLFSLQAGDCRHDDGATPLPAHTLCWFDSAPASLAFAVHATTGIAQDATVGWWIAVTPEHAEP